MKEGWEYRKLGDLCDQINGLWKGKKAPFINVGVIRNANFTKDFTLCTSNIEYLDVEERQYAKRKLIPGDLIVEKSGGSEKQPVGRAVLFTIEDGEYSFSNFTSVLRIKNKDGISPKFLYDYLLYIYKRGDTKAMQNATTGIHNIIWDAYLAIDVPAISLSEQQSIVEYLDSSFAKIDAMKANAEKALNEAKALFQAALKSLLEPKEGWEEKTVGDVISHLRTGLNPRVHFKLNTPDAEGYYITVRELKGFNIETDAKTDRVNKAAIKRINERSNLKIGDVLFSGTGTIGKTALVTELPENWNIKEGVYAMTPKHSELDSKWFIYYIGSDFFLNMVKAKATGTGVQSIPMKELVKFPIYIPVLSEQQAIAFTLDNVKSRIDRLQSNFDKISQECDALKQALLKQVFE